MKKIQPIRYSTNAHSWWKLPDSSCQSRWILREPSDQEGEHQCDRCEHAAEKWNSTEMQIVGKVNEQHDKHYPDQVCKEAKLVDFGKQPPNHKTTQQAF
jgi:hypothetical protein